MVTAGTNLMDVRLFGTDGQPHWCWTGSKPVSGLSGWAGRVAFQFPGSLRPRARIQTRRFRVAGSHGIALQPQDAPAAVRRLAYWNSARCWCATPITWLDEMRGAPKLQLDKVNFRLDCDGPIHRFGLTAVPPAQIASPLVARGEFLGRDVRELQSWNGKLYAEIGYVDLALAQVWIPAPLELASGLDRAHVAELNGTLCVRPPRREAHQRADTAGIQSSRSWLCPSTGRLGWTQRGDAHRSFRDFVRLTAADGLKLAPTQFSYAQSGRCGRAPYRVHTCRASTWLPWLNSRISAAGRRAARPSARACPTEPWKCYFSWDAIGARRSLMWRRRDFAAWCAPAARFPDFTVSAAIRRHERADGNRSRQPRGFELPKILPAAAAGFFTINAGWTFREGVIDVAVKNANFTNEHVCVQCFRSYAAWPGRRQRGPERGAGARGCASALRYMPVSRPSRKPGSSGAACRAVDGPRARLKGPLKDFHLQATRTASSKS